MSYASKLPPESKGVKRLQMMMLLLLLLMHAGQSKLTTYKHYFYATHHGQ